MARYEPTEQEMQAALIHLSNTASQAVFQYPKQGLDAWLAVVDAFDEGQLVYHLLRLRQAQEKVS